MSCPHCGTELAPGGGTCPSCGATVVDPDRIDSLLALPAEQVPEPVEPAEGPDVVRPLPVSAEVVAEQFLDPGPLASHPIAGELGADPGGGGPDDQDGSADPLPASPPPSPPAVDPALASPRPAVDPGLPTELVAAAAPRATQEVASGEPEQTGPRWGPRSHPAPVMAPPPPHPLEAPAVVQVRKPSGTGLPPGLSAATTTDRSEAGPAAGGPPPAPPIDPPAAKEGRRGRRWFGRGGGDDTPASGGPTSGSGGPADAPGPPPAAPSAAEPSHAADGPVTGDGGSGDAPSAAELFPGAPDGLLDGVVPEPSLDDAPRDPAGLDESLGRSSAGARRAAQPVLPVVAALLERGEVAEVAVVGTYQHRPGLVVLTDRRVLVANDRPWAPDVRSLPLDERLVVHGWQDERRADLVFVVDGVGVHVAAISDRPLARDLAQRVRARCGAPPPG